MKPLRFLERAMGIEPTSEAWEASILPLYDARSAFKLAKERIGRKRGDLPCAEHSGGTALKGRPLHLRGAWSQGR